MTPHQKLAEALRKAIPFIGYQAHVPDICEEAEQALAEYDANNVTLPMTRPSGLFVPSPATDNRLDAFEQQLRARGLDAASEKAMIEDCKLDEALFAANEYLNTKAKPCEGCKYPVLQDVHVETLIQAASRPEPECVTKMDCKWLKETENGTEAISRTWERYARGKMPFQHDLMIIISAASKYLKIVEGKNDE